MLVLMSCTMLLSAPITMIGGIMMAMREDVGLSWLVVVAVPLLAGAVGADHQPDAPAVQGAAGSGSTR